MRMGPGPSRRLAPPPDKEEKVEADMAGADDLVGTHRFTRRDGFRLAGIAAGAVAVSSFWPSSAATGSVLAPAQTTPVWNHDPASAIGPSHWGTIGFPTCGN